MNEDILLGNGKRSRVRLKRRWVNSLITTFYRSKEKARSF